MDINRVVLVGRLTRDPDLKHTGGGSAVCELGLALNSREKDSEGEWVDRADFFDVVVFGNQAESCAQYLAKGRRTAVEGRLRLERWETKDGEKRSKVRVVASNVQFLEGTQQENGQAEPAAVGGGAEFGGVDADIPFE